MLGSSSCRAVVAALVEGRASPVVSSHLLDELRRVASRPKFQTVITAAAIEELIHTIQPHALVVTPRHHTHISRDPDDNHLLDLAREGAVDAIVSGDHDLTTLGTFLSIPILMPGQFLAKLSHH